MSVTTVSGNAQTSKLAFAQSCKTVSQDKSEKASSTSAGPILAAQPHTMPAKHTHPGVRASFRSAHCRVCHALSRLTKWLGYHGLRRMIELPLWQRRLCFLCRLWSWRLSSRQMCSTFFGISLAVIWQRYLATKLPLAGLSTTHFWLPNPPPFALTYLTWQAVDGVLAVVALHECPLLRCHCCNGVSLDLKEPWMPSKKTSSEKRSNADEVILYLNILSLK